MGMNIEQKVRIKIWQMNVNTFSSQVVFGVNRLLHVIINGKNFYDQASDSDIKQYEEIIKLTTGQGEDCTTGCLLGYDYIKNHSRLIVVDLSRQKESGADPKTIQQIEFVGEFKNDNDQIVANESMLALTILEKIKEFF